MIRVDVRPEFLDWALERAGLTREEAEAAIPNLPKWRSGRVKPTLKQLEGFASRTHTPIGYFFLSQPPIETVPIPDFRTIRDEQILRPSADILETIYTCQQRQGWFREYQIAEGGSPVELVGSLTEGMNVAEAAARIRAQLSIPFEQRGGVRSREKALDELVRQVEELGVLVMRNSIVGNNTRRPLNPEEFRGFALCDDWAPLIFVNSADSKSAQLFTLAHELVHIFVGQSAVTNAALLRGERSVDERWTNRVAAEVLVPETLLRSLFQPTEPLLEEVERLSIQFKVSTLVLLRRLHDAGLISRDALWEAYEDEVARAANAPRRMARADFYTLAVSRVSRRFATALLQSTYEGGTLYRDASQMLGLRKEKTLKGLAERLEVRI